jgi:succinate dehydrogenase/fumarate reductase flavoprotein subunit
VVLAAGGYPANTRLLESYSDPNAGALMVRGVPWATGDGLEMARGVGAGWKGMGGVMALHVAAVDPVETAAGNPFSLLPHAISVNRQGQRFIDETRGYVAHGKAVLEQPGQRAALVFDEKIAELPAAESTLGTFRRLGIDVKSAGSLADLARAIEVPPEALEDTVTRYNAAAKEGRADGLEPPKSDYAHVVEGPTYHALYPLAPGVTLTFGGLMIDTSARVLEADERVIPGLFAAGEGAGHAFFNDYVGGGALTNCLVMGRIAGRRAAGG